MKVIGVRKHSGYILALILLLLSFTAYSNVQDSKTQTINYLWTAIEGSKPQTFNAKGDPRIEAGAFIQFNSIGLNQSTYSGVMGEFDPGAYRGYEVELTAAIHVKSGDGGTYIWIRSDAPARRSMFITSSNNIVRIGLAEKRAIKFYIPFDTDKIVLGVYTMGTALSEVSDLKIRKLPKPTNVAVTAYAVTEYAISQVKQHALNAKNVNFDALTEQLLTKNLQNTHPLEAYVRIRTMLSALNDNHSRVKSPQQTTETLNNGIRSQPIKHRLDNEIGYLSIPGFSGLSELQGIEFSNDICSAINSIATSANRGWIIDLRGNSGGNMWPMLAGLKPFLGNGAFGYFRDRDKIDTPWLMQKTDGCNNINLDNTRVAVIIGKQTASSGEAVAIAFSGRKNTTFFGEKSAGLSTSNIIVKLPDGGSIYLTNAIDIDRNGKEFPAGITPDVIILNEPSQDAPLQSAIDWLLNKSN